jgi:cell division septal protein FtsQ
MRKSRFKKPERISSGINPKFIWISFLLLGFCVSIFYAWHIFSKSEFFSIKEVKSNIKFSDEFTNEIKGKSLLNLDTKRIYLRIYRSHPEYKSINVIKQFPATLKIDIKLRIPVAKFYAKKAYFIDKEGVIIGSGEEVVSGVQNPAPILTADQKLILIAIDDYNTAIQRGSQIRDKRLVLAFELMQAIAERKFLQKLPVRVVNTTFGESAYFIVGNAKIIIGNDDIARRLYILENILNNKLDANLSNVEYIDLRYKKAYVSYRQ